MFAQLVEGKGVAKKQTTSKVERVILKNSVDYTSRQRTKKLQIHANLQQ